MTTIQDVIGDFTPLSNNVVKQLKLIRGAIACKIFYTSNLSDRVCRMGLTRLSQELGIDTSTISKNIQWLIDNNFLERVKDHTATDPAHYRCTEQFYQIAKGIDLIKSAIDLSNRGIDDINTGIDLINQEEELEKELKEEYKNVDYLDLVIKQEVSETTAPNPDDQWLAYRDPVIKAYGDQTGVKLNQSQRGELGLLAGKDGFDIEVYHKYLNEFATRGGYVYDVRAFCEGYWKYLKTGNIHRAMGRKQNEDEEGEVRKHPPLSSETLPDGRVIVW